MTGPELSAKTVITGATAGADAGAAGVARRGRTRDTPLPTVSPTSSPAAPATSATSAPTRMRFLAGSGAGQLHSQCAAGQVGPVLVAHDKLGHEGQAGQLVANEAVPTWRPSVVRSRAAASRVGIGSANQVIRA